MIWNDSTQYFRDNWSALVERFTLDNGELGDLIIAVTSTFNNDKKLQDVSYESPLNHSTWTRSADIFFPKKVFWCVVALFLVL